jgi:predicted DNA-binding transcriptional regulator YafY
VVFAVPQLLDGTRVHQIFERLQSASRGPDGSQSLVRFKYRDAKQGASVERTVEPHRVLIRSGSAYLIGYDLDRRAWRTFALDRFTTLPVKCGTVLRKRQIPEAYAETGVIGFIKSDGRPQRVSVELSPRVAAAATSRKWQDAQTTELFLDGRAIMTFTVSDPAEVIRWALGFGAEAKVIAPDAAVELARDMIQSLTTRYSSPA